VLLRPAPMILGMSASCSSACGAVIGRGVLSAEVSIGSAAFFPADKCRASAVTVIRRRHRLYPTITAAGLEDPVGAWDSPGDRGDVRPATS
jgi:hypothetical protein